jgi:hypothetical protein
MPPHFERLALKNERNPKFLRGQKTILLKRFQSLLSFENLLEVLKGRVTKRALADGKATGSETQHTSQQQWIWSKRRRRHEQILG